MSLPSTRVERPARQTRSPRRRLLRHSETCAVQNFRLSGVPFVVIHLKLVIALAMVKQAAADANRELGPPVRRQTHRHQHRLCTHHPGRVPRPVRGRHDPGRRRHLDQHERQRVIANRAPEPWAGEGRLCPPAIPNEHVNMGQSTNDVYPTAIRVGLLLGIAGWSRPWRSCAPRSREGPNSADV